MMLASSPGPQSVCHAGSVYQALGRMAAGMTRADGLFHLALAGILVFGGLFADQIGSAMWDSLNRGVRVMHLAVAAPAISQPES